MPTYRGCKLLEPLLVLIDATIGAREAVKPFDTASTKGCIADSFSNGIIASALLPSANLAQCSLLNTPPVAWPALPPDTFTLILELELLKPKNSFTLSIALPILSLIVLQTLEAQLDKVLKVLEHQLENETPLNESNLFLQFVHQVLIFPAVSVAQVLIFDFASVAQEEIFALVSVAHVEILDFVSVAQLLNFSLVAVDHEVTFSLVLVTQPPIFSFVLVTQSPNLVFVSVTQPLIFSFVVDTKVVKFVTLSVTQVPIEVAVSVIQPPILVLVSVTQVETLL